MTNYTIKTVMGDFAEFKQLDGYENIQHKDLVADGHIRYVKRDYATKKNKCVYAVISSCEEGEPLKLRSYVPWNSKDAPMTWQITQDQLKWVRFYRKKEEKTQTSK